ncbi:MAG: molybdate ABC transporter permease subunit [Clostridiaceae bacterium]
MDFYSSPIWISLKTAFVATIITLFLGVLVGKWMAEYRGKLKGVWDAIFTLSMVLPPTVVGFFLLVLLGKNGPIGQLLLKFDKTLIFSWPAEIITATVVAFPLMYKTSRSSFEQIDQNVINAARTLGVSEWRIFYRIMLPLSWPGIAAGVVLAFARALGEFGATLMVAGSIPGKTTTIPTAIYFAVVNGEMDKALSLVLFIVAISMTVIVLTNIWSDDKLKFTSQSRRN